MSVEQQAGARPQKVATAVMFLYVTLGIGVLRSVMEFPRLLAQTSTVFVAVVTIAVFGFTWFFISRIGKGKNWARITFLVLFILGVPLSIWPLLQSLAVNPLSGVLGLGQCVLQAIAVVFLFQQHSSEWFKKKPEINH